MVTTKPIADESAMNWYFGTDPQFQEQLDWINPPSSDLFPSYTLPTVTEAGRRKFAAAIAEHGLEGVRTP